VDELGPPDSMSFGTELIRDSMPDIRHALTVDVEDWPQSTLDQSLPITERAVRNTHAMLELFARHDVRGTFFVLGLLAEKYPQVVREIDAAGHEVASHGYSHKAVFQIGPDAFRDELIRSRRQLEDLTGKQVLGYRAPDFSITSASLWALDVLAEQGFVYDSSVFPVKLRRYGIADFPRRIHRLENGLVEVPMSSVLFASRRWPVAGGGYLRLLPVWLTALAMRRLESESQPAIIYLHPYEIDAAELGELKLDIPWKTRLTQGLNRSRVAPRLEYLFRQFHFTTLADLISRDASLATATASAGALQPQH
jgi:polysaccharide deacetylase family protein (PEP-CTERM system associated)